MAHREGLITRRRTREERRRETRGGDEERLVKVLPQLPSSPALFTWLL